MPPAIERLAGIASNRGLCTECSWSTDKNVESNVQDHARHFGHRTVTIGVVLNVYAPTKPEPVAQ